MTSRCLLWLPALLLSIAACRKQETLGSDGGSSPVASEKAASTGSIPSGEPSNPESGACQADLDYLVLPQKYDDGDLFRAIAVDEQQVFVRNLKDVFSVPLSGGALTFLSKGPGLTLDGRAKLWASGDRLLTQSSREPIFMAAPKAKGEWKTLIDLTSAKQGGGRDAATRVLQGLATRGATPSAGSAIFDGSAFYWTEEKPRKNRDLPASSSIRTVSVTGGEGRTLFETSGELSQLAKAGERLVFVHTAPVSAAEREQRRAQGKKGKYQFASRGQKSLKSIAVAGESEALHLARFANVMGGELLFTDGDAVFVSGYEDEDLTKPGIFRISAKGGEKLTRLDKRNLFGQGFTYGDRYVIAGTSTLEAGGTASGQVVLTGLRTGGELTRAACLVGPYTAHAFAIAGKTLLVSLFKGDTKMASIVRFALP